jgi:UDP-2-acetamido-3-amino-2,3-dideoxy-glucuronate N-acetyltransferase
MIHSSADVDERAVVRESASIWHLAQVREHASIGDQVIIGRGAYVGPGVIVGDHSKVQNGAMLYEPAVLEAGVFVGPAVILTNDRHPRAVRPDGEQMSRDDWSMEGVRVCQGASIGARAVCVAPVRIGRWAMIAAGSVVVRDVADFALMMGVPARQVGWVGHSGIRLESDPESPGRYRCPETHDEYVILSNGAMQPATDES